MILPRPFRQAMINQQCNDARLGEKKESDILELFQDYIRVLPTKHLTVDAPHHPSTIHFISY